MARAIIRAGRADSSAQGEVMKMLKIAIVVAAIALVAGIIGCVVHTQSGGTSSEEPDKAAEPAPVEQGTPPAIEHPAAGGGEPTPAAPAGGACSSDADCVPAECCHPKTCTAKENAPDCKEMMCTLDCRAGTMDCGWGKCICKDGQCAAEINPPPKPPIMSDPKIGKPIPE
jgi:hypothetical protein